MIQTDEDRSIRRWIYPIVTLSTTDLNLHGLAWGRNCPSLWEPCDTPHGLV